VPAGHGGSAGTPATIDRVLPMPAPAVMARMIAALGGELTWGLVEVV
jgi:hypothetical protein